jgi:hypothetical protein
MNPLFYQAIRDVGSLLMDENPKQLQDVMFNATDDGVRIVFGVKGKQGEVTEQFVSYEEAEQFTGRDLSFFEFVTAILLARIGHE